MFIQKPSDRDGIDVDQWPNGVIITAMRLGIAANIAKLPELVAGC